MIKTLRELEYLIYTPGQKLVLIRGLPGSGKSTLSADLDGGEDINDFHHFEADSFFMQNGVYIFDQSKLGAAHKWCQSSTESWLALGESVIVSNTFTTLKELSPYINIARVYNINPIVITCTSDFGNVHNVPQEAIERMKARWVSYPGEYIYEAESI